MLCWTTPLQTPHGMWRAVLPHQEHRISWEGWILWEGACLGQPRVPASLLTCKLCLPWWTGSALIVVQNQSSLPMSWRKLDEFWTEGCQATQNYLATAMQVGSLGSPAARVTWMWTSGALSYFCRSYTPLPLSQLSLACCLISEPPLPLSHRQGEKPGGKVCYLFSGHLPGCTGPSIPDPLASLCSPLTPFLHFGPMCCRGRSTYSSVWVAQSCCLGYKAGQIRYLSACQKHYSQ